MPSAYRGGFVRDLATRALLVRGLGAAVDPNRIPWTGTGATTQVTDVAGLTSALAAASTGDTIELADGTYDLTSTVTVSTPGIRLKAATPKGAVLRGATTAPTAANVETTPAHTVFGIQVRADGVYVEDVHFKWFGIAVDLDGVDDVVVQGCRIESCFDVGVQSFDCARPTVHMCELLDPYLAGDAHATLTTRGLADAQMDYGVNFYGCISPRASHNYFFGVFNQACSFKEGNQDAYAGYNTFDGSCLTALFLGQNEPHNGPYANTGLLNGPEIGAPVLEYNAFRYVDDGAGGVYFMGIPWRIWYVDADVTCRGNVVESSSTGPQVQASGTGIAAGTVLFEDNTFIGTIDGTQANDDGGIAVNNGVTAVITIQDNTFSSLPAGSNVAVFSDGLTGTPDITETGSVTDARESTLRAPVVAFDPDLSLAGGGGSAPAGVSYVGLVAPAQGGGNSVSIDRHASAQVGDVQLVHIAVFDNTVPITPPAGWTTVIDKTENTAGAFASAVFMRVDDGSAGPWTFTTTGAGWIMAEAHTYRGLTGAVQASSMTPSTFTDTTAWFTAITTTAPDTLVVALVSLASNRVITYPGDPWTARSTNSDMAAMDETQAAAGSTGTPTITFDNFVTNNGALIALTAG